MQQLCRCLRVAFSGTQADIDARKRLFGDKTGHTLRRRIRKRFPFGRRIRNQPHARILPDGAWHAQPGQPRTLTLRALPVVKHAELKQRYLFFRQNKIDFTRAQIGERLHAAVDFRRQVCPQFRAPLPPTQAPATPISESPGFGFSLCAGASACW